eukprot:2149799-Rhodomonas_salina.8
MLFWKEIKYKLGTDWTGKVVACMGKQQTKARHHRTCRSTRVADSVADAFRVLEAVCPHAQSRSCTPPKRVT